MFAKNLKYLRNKYDIEQLDLAHKLGRKSSSSISEWEKGKYTPNFGTLKKISEIFNVSVEDLMEVDLSQRSKNKSSNKSDVIAAHIDDDVTDEEMKEILNFIDYIKQKEK